MTDSETVKLGITKSLNILPRIDLFDIHSPKHTSCIAGSAIRPSISVEARNAELTLKKDVLDRNVRDEAKAVPDLHIQAPTLASGEIKEQYWQKVHQWQHVSEQDFLSHRWQASQYKPDPSRPRVSLSLIDLLQTAHGIRDKEKLLKFLASALPEKIDTKFDSAFEHIRTRDDFIKDVDEGIQIAPMAIRLTPHILSVVDWNNAIADPIRRQFIPMKSSAMPDHPMLTLDSLNEEGDSPVKGLVHRYPDKALFLGG
jgi:lysine 2,3-aminomutase